jgi:hypothetical protein
VGSKSLTATYAGDANFNASPASAAASHTVNKANTAAAITSDTPDPSTQFHAVTVQYTVPPQDPGGGTPTGNVTVSDGVDSCTATVAAGQCMLTLTTTGTRTLTATYAGDTNYNGSTSAGESHVVVVPSAVTIASFTARAGSGRVLLRWRTVSEVRLVGFSVWRASSPAGRSTKITRRLIPATALGQGGSVYTFTDRTAKARRTYVYELRAVLRDGTAQRVGTARARGR